LLKESAVDYLAIDRGSLRETIVGENSLAQHPGRTQGLNPQHTGRNGCSLVHVDVNAGIRTDFIDTARVCWEQLPLEIKPDTGRGQLLRMMKELLCSFQQEALDKILIIHWLIRGSGALFDSLCDEEFCNQLTISLSEDSSLASCLHMAHVIHPKPAGKSKPVTQCLNSSSVLNEFLEFVNDTQHVSPELLGTLFDATPIQKENRSNRFHSFRTQCDPNTVREHVERLGKLWFAADPVGEQLP
ncbi:MAG: hypothetical protein IID46_06080, partial [Planctomycetes bacterium]|nr:hypothetical protein [Planctomycetota bacterium]